jgi:NAD(P)-dependent dehydrogenase (short-subunit alcohol dehydrogenase family)
MSAPPSTLSQFDIRGRSGLVTGAASGIGLAYAEMLAEAGAAVTLTDIDGDAAEREAERLRGLGQDARAVQLDVTDDASVRAAVKVVEADGGLDVLINNAGIGGAVTPVDQYSGDEWHRVIETNLSSVFYGIKYGARAMKLRAERGVIVSISSILGFVGLRGAPAYVAAKHAIVGLTKSAALDLAPSGIRVLAVAPAFVHTPMIAGAEEAMLPLHPIGRLGSPGDVASLVSHLAADESSFLTGATYLVDGGYTAQ